MTVNTPALPLPDETSGRHSTGWWGMVLLIINEAILFASLIASYFYIRFNSPAWPQDGLAKPELVLPVIGTIVLLSSSLALHYGERGIRQGNQRHLQIGYLIGFILGVIFIGIQLYEYSRTPFRPSDNVYASLFFAITGIHGLHVTLGLLMNLVVQIRASSGYFTSSRFLAVENSALYWHFVDVVWLFVFASLYLSPYI